jgi:uncharacterized protein YyaL (SSP411 family)
MALPVRIGHARRTLSRWASLPLCLALLACPKAKEGAIPMELPPFTPPPGAEAYPEALRAELARALEKQGPSYRPRTHHLLPGGRPKYTNRLIQETSPYLLQHAHNPVDWHAWGKEAFEKARRLGRPVLLSVGYSTCHWCHVMERESFEDEEIAAFINAHYVAIKVDREERPDVDSVYMTAVQMMTGSGGWPMTVVMTPAAEPFFGGTYFPARDGDRGSRIGFLTVLKKLADAYKNDPAAVKESTDRLVAALRSEEVAPADAGVPGTEALIGAAMALAQRFDPEHGGFGRAPKFPRPSTFEFLLRYWRRTGDRTALQMVTHSLDKMADGGIYDHLAGGFARYSTDREWLVPHFEKMLYDNAQLVSLFVETWQATADDRHREVAIETLDYVLREMTSPDGGFYSATDADSEGEEGLFFVWTPAQIGAVVGPAEAKVVNAYYGVTEAGNFEGKNILHRPRPKSEVAKLLGLSVAQLEDRIRAAKAKLYAAREQRDHPILDDKILTEWNAQMIGAFARAGFAFHEPKYLAAATRAADFLLTHLQKDGRLLRAYRAGQAKHAAVLEDYTFFVSALLDLYEATAELRWLNEAQRLEKEQERLFLDEKAGGFFATASDGEVLLVREKPNYDGAQPAGASVAAANLLRFAELSGDEAPRRLADGIFKAAADGLKKGALQSPKLAAALDFALDRPKEIVLVTTADDDGAALLQVLRRAFLPNRVLVRVKAEEVEALTPQIPLVEGKRPLQGKATVYVCVGQTCKQPTSDPKVLAAQLDDVVRIPAPPLQLSTVH